MARVSPRGRRPSDQDVTPTDQPQIPPPHHTPQYDFTLHGIMEIKEAIGKLDAKVDRLITDVGEHGKDISRTNKIIFAAGVVLFVLLSIGTFALNKIWDTLIAALKAAA